MRPRARFVAALCLLAGCQGYARTTAPLAPGMGPVRIVFDSPRAVVVARDDTVAGVPDTLDDVSVVQGRVVELRDDTLRLAVSQVMRRGSRQYIPSGRHVTIDMSTASGVERRSVEKAAAQGLIVVAVVVAAASVLVYFASRDRIDP